MDDDKILELTGKIEETLGKEEYAMISDTIGEILTGNAQNMQTRYSEWCFTTKSTSGAVAG